MKRFYCTVCKKFKRVRVMPASVVTPHAPKPEDRKGVCKWHVNVVVDYDKLNRKVS